ncbi:hypothetical protein GUITHDRAFT_114079 [Guillardia theta CCMP2712]|uniref:Uncharacterized protein n=1 Tax=Guillardia theta (strain CCMP2712) TaxID=905079 RepID=L1IVD1_GUITC|nr:hypothetical protein GUITHDRAFT_114079 [Guillardia theta CCMP2712]EKX39829.1 hypothetical protein GUITHDRAFT_114079 [Guillardia theta CCMP2712]|eukprot:XP_005826809.1 hypothetical protein GUITHDRAFT_114079 [Guillardia theta CCMP2712]
MILAMLSSMYFSICLRWIQILKVNGIRSFRYYRFSVEGIRSRGNSTYAHAQTFGILKDGVDVRNSLWQKSVRHNMTWQPDGSILLSFEQPVQANGFYFMTESTNPELDPVLFHVTASDDRLRWETFGSSSFSFDWLISYHDTRRIFILSDESYPTTFMRNEVEVFDMSAPRLKTCLLITINLIRTFTFGLPAFLGLSKQEFVAKRVLQSGMIIAGCVKTVLAIYDPYNRGSILLHIILTVFMALSIQLFDDDRTFWGSLLVLYSAWAIIGMRLANNVNIIYAVSVCSVSALILVYRSRIAAEIRKLALTDKNAYDSAWLSMSSLSENARLIDLLREELNEFPIPLRSEARHYEECTCRMGLGSESSFSDERGTPKGSCYQQLKRWCRLRSPVSSLDRLYAQAACVQCLLHDKISQREPGGLLLAGATLKSSEQAIEKALRCYKGDGSRVVDICRQRLVVDSMDHLLKLVQLIKDDDALHIVRVKDRMTLPFNHPSMQESCGFRAVLLNFHFLTDEALSFGLAGHICEVQLTLKEFAALCSAESHQRYKRYRYLIRH